MLGDEGSRRSVPVLVGGGMDNSYSVVGQDLVPQPAAGTGAASTRRVLRRLAPFCGATALLVLLVLYAQKSAAPRARPLPPTRAVVGLRAVAGVTNRSATGELPAPPAKKDKKKKAADDRDAAILEDCLHNATNKTNAAEDAVEKAVITSELIASSGDDLKERRQAVAQTEAAVQEAQKALGEAKIHLNAKTAQCRRFESEAVKTRATEALAQLQAAVVAATAKLTPLQEERQRVQQRVVVQKLLNSSSDPILRFRSNVDLKCSPPMVPIAQPGVDLDGQPSPSAGLTCGCPLPGVLAEGGGQCTSPTGPVQMSFYVYRAQGDEDYPLENVNVADLAGVMAYLHHEIVPFRPRKFDITRILRFKLTVENSMTSNQFGPFVAFDSGQCTVPGCESLWEQYGYFVGCQTFSRDVANYANDFDLDKYVAWADADFGEFPKGFHGGIWYSLPGSCPGVPVKDKEQSCASAPSGLCKGLQSGDSLCSGESEDCRGSKCCSSPGQKCYEKCQEWAMCLPSCIPGVYEDGPWSCNVLGGGEDSRQTPGDGSGCTFTYESLGEVRLDDLAGILDPQRGIDSYEQWLTLPTVEYDRATDRGVGTDFWNGISDLEQGVRRMYRLRQLFREKYPHLPDDLPGPPCS